MTGTDQSHANARQQATDEVHARLAGASAAIWILGIFFVHLIEPDHTLERMTNAAVIVLLFPAAGVWLLRPFMIRARIRKRIEAQKLDKHPSSI